VQKKCCKSIHPHPCHSSFISFCLCWWVWRGRWSFWYMTREDTITRLGSLSAPCTLTFFWLLVRENNNYWQDLTSTNHSKVVAIGR